MRKVTDPVAFLGQTLSSRENFPYLFSQIILPPNSLSYATTLRQGLPAVSPPNLSGTIPVPGYAYIKTYNNVASTSEVTCRPGTSRSSSG